MTAHNPTYVKLLEEALDRLNSVNDDVNDPAHPVTPYVTNAIGAVNAAIAILGHKYG